MKKVIILIGNYGSGKTEIALNIAISSANKGMRTQVIDLDRINDYFRMSDQVELLTDRSISIVSPTFAGLGITQTNMPAAVASAFDQDWDLVIFDVGGDPAGAMSLARYHSDFSALPPESLDVYDIVNVYRPMSESSDKIMKLKDSMESFARLTVSGFINNSNLLNYTTVDCLLHGYDVLAETSAVSGIPVAYTSGRNDVIEQFQLYNKDSKYIGGLLKLEQYMHRSADDFRIAHSKA